jgi:hypothetical protein
LDPRAAAAGARHVYRLLAICQSPELHHPHDLLLLESLSPLLLSLLQLLLLLLLLLAPKLEGD